MIAAVDEFILYDDMQYTRRDWRNRNQIKTPHGVQWLNANTNAELQALAPANHYFNYCKNGKGIDHVPAFEKLIYKNLYPGIDVEYVFHPQEGIEYNIILHSGADASLLRMSFDAKSLKSSIFLKWSNHHQSYSLSTTPAR